ncbi:MAG: glutamine amidotransferase, partial [Planctomycetota bacterium]|nr:glutamine amidotransferase [Planctomycetota bacterium]
VETAAAALKTISRLDYFGIVSASGFSGHHWEVPMQIAANKDAIKRKILRMMNADMFDFETPMRMAYNALMQCKDAAQRHMIIISDGDPQAPSRGLINLMVGNKITCSTVLVFPHGGGEIQTMKNIAKKTGGRYWLLQKPGDEKRLPRIFVKEARIVRRPLIRDEIFTPKVRQSLSDIMEGIGTELPQLKGYVVTTPRKQADVEIPLVTEKGDPLLAHWQCGVGRTVAFTSGRWKYWGADWTSWPSFSKIWAQSLRWCMRQGSAADYDLTVSREGDVAHLILDSISENEGFANYRRFEGVVIHDGESRQVRISQTGPGRYEAFFPAKKQGIYLINIRAPGTNGQKPAMIRAGLTVPYSAEFREVGSNEALLTNIADETGGTIHSLDDPDSERVFARLAPTVSRKPIWNKLLQWAILLFLLDVAVRRIAIDPVKILAVSRAHIASLAGRFGSGKRAEATLSSLKDVRQRLQTERTGEGDISAIATDRADRTVASKEIGPSAMSGAKFDAGSSGKPSGDLTKIMGGAEGGKVDSPKPAPSDKTKEQPPAESMTARLLKARKQAKGNQGEDKQ